MLVELTSLSDALKFGALTKHLSIRDIAQMTGLTVSTAWRTINHPMRAEARHLIPVIECLEVPLSEFLSLWHGELRKAKVFEEVKED